MRSITIYRENKSTGEVEKIEVTREPVEQRTEGENYHQRIINTYHELECEGKLGDMSTKAKKFVREVHEHAQQPGYWHSDAYGYQGMGNPEVD
jgi:hypothetical protein